MSAARALLHAAMLAAIAIGIVIGVAVYDLLGG